MKLQNQYWHIYCEGQDQNEEALEKIMTEEKSLFQPLQVDPEILEELVGSDVEKKVCTLYRLDLVQVNLCQSSYFCLN